MQELSETYILYMQVFITYIYFSTRKVKNIEIA